MVSDRGWLQLYGQKCERRHVVLTDGERRDSLLWWFFQVWESLPGFYRAGDVRNCCNQLLDMVNAYGLSILVRFRLLNGELKCCSTGKVLVLPLGSVKNSNAVFTRGFAAIIVHSSNGSTGRV